LGLLTNPKHSPETEECNLWVRSLLAQRAHICVPEIADYELRRELLRGNKKKGLKRLDDFEKLVNYVPLSTAVMRKAAELWAHARQQGRPTADNKALDGDMILTAQALVFASSEDDVIIATTNVGHLSLFAKAAHWKDIHP
jgi:predicted nucleic acid-binding protein